MTISRKFNESPHLQDGAYCWQREMGGQRFRFGRVIDVHLSSGMARVAWIIGWPDYRRERARSLMREIERAKLRGRALSFKVLDRRLAWINNRVNFDTVPVDGLLPLSREVGGFVIDVLKRTEHFWSDLKFQSITEICLERELEMRAAGEDADLDPDSAFAVILECAAEARLAERAP